MVFRLCVFSNVPSSQIFVQNIFHTFRTWKVSLLCESFGAVSRHLNFCKICHIVCIWMPSLLCGSFRVFLSYQMLRMSSHIFFAIEWLLSGVCFVMDFQMACCGKAAATLCTPKWFSPVCVSSCVFKWVFCENLLSHCPHRKGFSPVWVL